MLKNSDIIEEISVEAVKKILRKMKSQYELKDIKYEVHSNDKGEFTDGYISVKGRRVDIQLKGKLKSDKKYQVDTKYLKYAANQLLMFIVVSGIDIDNDTYYSVYYQFMGIEFLENLRDNKPKCFEQKTVTVTFNRKLKNYSQFFKDFNYEVKQNHVFKTFNPKKNMKYIGKIKAQWEPKLNKFNPDFTTSDFSLYDKHTGIEYYAGNNMKMISINPKEEHIVEVDNNVSKLFIETDILNNKRLSTKNIQVDLIHNTRKVHFNVSYPTYLNDVTTEDVYLLKQIILNVNEDTNRILQRYEETFELKNKIFRKIPIHYKIELEEDRINYVYNLLFTEVPSDIDISKLILIDCEGELLVLIFNDYTRTYDYISDDTRIYSEEYMLELHPVTMKLLMETKWTIELEKIMKSNSNLKKELSEDFLYLLFLIIPGENHVAYYTVLISMIVMIFDKEFLLGDIIKERICLLCYPSDDYETYPMGLIFNYLYYKLKVNEKLSNEEICKIMSLKKLSPKFDELHEDLFEVLFNHNIDITNKYDKFPMFVQLRELLEKEQY